MTARTFAGAAMGSPLRMTVVADRDPAAAWHEVEAIFSAVAQVLTRFDRASALSALNVRAGSGAWVDAPPLLRAALVLARRAQVQTDGTFDPRIILALEEAGERAGIELPATRCAPGDPWLEIAGHRVRLAAAVDLGGIGKGLALRLAARALAKRGASALIDAGGDLVMVGRPDDGPMWRIAIEDPRGGAIPLVGFEIAEGAVATSSTAVRRWEHAGRIAHHLIDPRTGRPAQGGLVSVTVAGPDPVWAEVYAKALLIEGRRTIRATSERLRLAAWWVTDNGVVDRSPRAAALERFGPPRVLAVEPRDTAVLSTFARSVRLPASTPTSTQPMPTLRSGLVEGRRRCLDAGGAKRRSSPRR